MLHHSEIVKPKARTLGLVNYLLIYFELIGLFLKSHEPL